MVAGVPLPSDVATLQRECAIAVRTVLADMAIPPDVDVTTTCPYGHPGKTLTRLAHEGDLLVLGHSARSLPSRLITGSVRRHCVRRARATLVVVRAPSLRSLDAAALEEIGTQVHPAGRQPPASDATGDSSPDARW
jgi:hypothetical protein